MGFLMPGGVSVFLAVCMFCAYFKYKYIVSITKGVLAYIDIELIFTLAAWWLSANVIGFEHKSFKYYYYLVMYCFILVTLPTTYKNYLA